MEHGARFLKCDLHMHTPADPAGWSGARMGEALRDRQTAAEQYVRQCYEQKLELVAITDHNFVSKSFLPVLREAAAHLSPEYGYVLTIMSGFEIQADVGKGVHVLAIFDPSVTDDEIDHVMTQCGIPVPRFDGSRPLPSVNKLSKILQTVQVPGARGVRGVVIFPHCQSDKGVFDNDRLANWLQQGEYKNPDLLCVEVSKPVEQMPLTWQRLFACDERCEEQWRRPRSLACIMSSDAKEYGDNNAPHNIGSRYTWIKLSCCTAEGLRQAFLAHRSRVRLTAPEFPSIHISEMSVSACKFFAKQPFTVPFNQQFNAIIGGRGTGKSTLLEYLRWALHDQPPTAPEGDTEVPPYAKNRIKIITETLQPQTGDAHVAVTFCVNGTPHVVTRHVRPDRTSLKIGDEPEQETNADEVRRLIPLQAYSQKQLSTIAVRVDELRRLIESPLQERLRGIKEQIEDLKRTIQDFFTRRGAVKTLEARIRAAEAERTSKKAQIEALRAQITTLLPQDAKTLDAHQAHLSEHQAVMAMEEDGASIDRILRAAIDQLSAIPRDYSLTQDLPQKAKLEAMLAQIVLGRDAAKARVQQAQNELAAALQVFAAQAVEWRVGFDGHVAAFAEAKERAQAHRQQLDQIEKLSTEVQQHDQQIQETIAERESVGFNPTEEESNDRRWIALHRERGDLLDRACSLLTGQSGGDIRAGLKRGADARHAFDRLKERLGGSHTRQDWLESLSRRVTEAANPAEEWTHVLADFRLLAEIPPELAQSTEVPACPALNAAGFNEQALRRVAAQLDMDGWLELSLISLEDKPEFFFRTGDSSDIRFESASPGQQATALLTVLLSQPGGPLLIDQPEDDLDNAIINRIVETIWSAKEKRQLIFSSHNANLVVNGDAELVIRCDYCSTESRSAGKIRCAGSIEEPDICDAIKEVMEGGEQAFELRKAKYGF